MTMPDGSADGVLVATLVDNAERLGLQWSLRPATIIVGNGPGSAVAFATLDADPKPTKVISLVGALFQGDRVMTLFAQPQGIYAISVLGYGGSTLPEDQSMGNVAGPQIATGAYTDVVDGAATPLSVAVTKQRSGTRICVTLMCQSFSLGPILNKGQWGVHVEGVDYDIVPYFFNTAGDHRAFSGIRHLAGISAGPQTVVIRWKQLSGAGTIQCHADDAYFLRVEETR